MDGMDYEPMVMDGETEQPQVKISAVSEDIRTALEWDCVSDLMRP